MGYAISTCWFFILNAETNNVDDEMVHHVILAAAIKNPNPPLSLRRTDTADNKTIGKRQYPRTLAVR